jgi:hypothetical protein
MGTADHAFFLRTRCEANLSEESLQFPQIEAPFLHFRFIEDAHWDLQHNAASIRLGQFHYLSLPAHWKRMTKQMYRVRVSLSHFLWLPFFVLFVGWMHAPAQIQAADFSVVTRLYALPEKAPLGENTTIFQGENVYDFPETGDQVTFFNKAENQFVILNTANKTWTRISTDQLLQYTAWLKEKSLESDDPLLRFCAAPKFEKRSENNGKYWFFEHPLLQYEVESDSFTDPQIGLQYRTFSDWYARLNTMLRPQSLPPFARLIVNQQIAQEGLLPKTVQLRISPSRHIGNEELTMQSVHQVHLGLSAKDRERLAWVESCRKKFPEVSLVAYRNQSPESVKGK